MIRANQTALLDAAGVLDATALASVLRGAEILLVVIGRVREQSHDQAHERGHNSQDEFHDAHSVTHAFNVLANRRLRPKLAKLEAYWRVR